MTNSTAVRVKKAPAPPEPAALPPAPPFDVSKLLHIRDKHDRLLDLYRRVSDLARSARSDCAHLRAAAATDPLNERQSAILDLPGQRIADVPSDVLRELGLDVQSVRRIVHASGRAAALRAEADEVAVKLAESRRLLDSLNAYVARWPGAT